MIIRVFDLETTGFNATDEVVEIGVVDVIHASNGSAIDSSASALVRPTNPIPPQASAIHHITDDDVADAFPWCDLSPHFFDAYGDGNVDLFCAHFAKFDGTFATDEVRGGRPLICTYKAALRVWPNAPGHSNQTLRYWLGLAKSGFGPPHRALPDAFVTALILGRLLEVVTIEQMIEWSSEPALYPTITFGKHEGKAWPEIPLDYLEWMLRQESMDGDALWNAGREIGRRQQVARQEFVEKARVEISEINTVDDLRVWFASGLDHRSRIGVVDGVPEFEALVAACVARKAEIEPQTQSVPEGDIRA